MTKQNTSTHTQPKRFNVSVVETFKDKDNKDQKRWHTVGVAFPRHDDKGMVINLVPGISVSGSLVVSEIEPRDNTK